MTVSRRNFVKGMGVGTSAAAIMAYDGPRSIARAMSMALPVQERPLLLHNNENPLGPGDAVIRAMNEAMDSGLGSLYGLPSRQTAEAIAYTKNIPNDRLMIGNGSTQLLRSATHVFTSPMRPLVTAAPSYEEAPGYANLIGHPVESVALDDYMMIDLDAMADAAKGAGMVFLCNPNNPTGTLHGADAVGAFIDRVLSETDAMIMVDEAYHDYVTDPSHETQIPRAIKEERVIVARTFSKAHGMAGMRIGWVVAHPDAIAKMRGWHYGGTLNAPSLLGAKASIEDPERIAKEQDRNTEARQFTIDWFKSKGLDATDSQTNFIFAKTGMQASTFRAGCAERNIRVGRNFPPYQAEWARISIGTIDEMRRAVDVFGRVFADSGGTTARSQVAA